MFDYFDLDNGTLIVWSRIVSVEKNANVAVNMENVGKKNFSHLIKLDNGDSYHITRMEFDRLRAKFIEHASFNPVAMMKILESLIGKYNDDDLGDLINDN